MVWNWISMTVEYDAVIHDGLVHVVGWSIGVLYSDDGPIGLWDPEWLQEAPNVLIDMFRCTGLMSNVAKSKIMTCHPGTILQEYQRRRWGKKINRKLLSTGRGCGFGFHDQNVR